MLHGGTSVRLSQQSSYDGMLRLGTVSLGGVWGYVRVLGLPQQGWRTIPADAGAPSLQMLEQTVLPAVTSIPLETHYGGEVPA